jgi:Flp pilus assembly protein TadG
MVSYAFRQRRPSRRRDRGAVAVEFALIMPMFIMLVLGVIQYGLYFWAAQGGSTAAREAARRAAVGDYTTCEQFVEDVRGRIDSVGDTASAVVTRTYVKGPGNLATAVEVGDVVTVKVTFRAGTIDLPMVPFLSDGLVTQSADARVENVPTASVGDCSA